MPNKRNIAKNVSLELSCMGKNQKIIVEDKKYFNKNNILVKLRM